MTKVVDTSSSVFYLKLSSAIIGPFLVLSCLALFVIYFIRRKHYKRATRSKQQQDPETYYASEDFRATSAGDSTLRVSIDLKTLGFGYSFLLWLRSLRNINIMESIA